MKYLLDLFKAYAATLLQVTITLGVIVVFAYWALIINFYPTGITISESLLFVFAALMFGLFYGLWYLLALGAVHGTLPLALGSDQVRQWSLYSRHRIGIGTRHRRLGCSQCENIGSATGCDDPFDHSLVLEAPAALHTSCASAKIPAPKSSDRTDCNRFADALRTRSHSEHHFELHATPRLPADGCIAEPGYGQPKHHKERSG